MIRTMLKQRFELTETESEMVLCLLAGASLHASAKTLSIEYETARTHLKSIFSKTATNRQSQLVVVVLRAAEATDADALRELLNPQCPNCGGTPDRGYDPATGACRNDACYSTEQR